MPNHRHASCPCVFVVMSPRRHPEHPSPGPSAGGPARRQPTPTPSTCPGGRLNLLLSYAGWQPDPLVNRLAPLLEPMGVTAHHAGTGREASRVIQATPIHIAVVDLALPLDLTTPQPEREPEFEEGGPRLLELLSRLDQPPPVVAIKRSRSTRDDARDLNAALRLGVFAVVDRPRELSDLNLILNVLRRCLERHYHGRWPAL